jgi:ubiquinone/menaquinone biosynthesis C-methylase UbiE
MSADSISLDNPTALAHLHVYSELGVNAVPPGASVLEIGCGQGDMSIVLAAAAGPTGHVTALDPGALDYGTPPLSV